MAVQGQTKRSKPNSQNESNVTLNNTNNDNTNNNNNTTNNETKPIVVDDTPAVPKTLDQLAAEAIIKGIIFILYIFISRRTLIH